MNKDFASTLRRDLDALSDPVLTERHLNYAASFEFSSPVPQHYYPHCSRYHRGHRSYLVHLLIQRRHCLQCAACVSVALYHV
jgi:hypothetical protein